jgi:hypothetical protein
METTVGRLLNKFKIKSRRNVLVFENILANYVKECEKAGYGKEMVETAQTWTNLVIQNVVPKILKKTPIFFINKIMKTVWVNLGLLSDIYAVKRDNLIEIETKNEAITRQLGKNECSKGFYVGILNILFNSHVECIKTIQTKKYCKYVYKIINKNFEPLKTKKKELYNKLNQLPKIKGITLKDALKANVFQLKNNNRLYFRGKSLWYVENTGFHILGNKQILLKKVPKISYDFFKQTVRKKSSNTEKLALIKTLLQSMGWGIISIINQKNKILFEISYLPYGLQKEKDNWYFLIDLILGYLWLINKKLKIKNVEKLYKKIIISYST